MISSKAREIAYDTYVNYYLKTFDNTDLQDLCEINKLLNKDCDFNDREYLGIINGMEYAYQFSECKSFRDRFYFSYGFSEYFNNVKDNSLDSSDAELHKLSPKDRHIASYGFMKAFEELKKGMESDGLIGGKQYEKSKH